MACTLPYYDEDTWHLSFNATQLGPSLMGGQLGFSHMLLPCMAPSLQGQLQSGSCFSHAFTGEPGCAGCYRLLVYLEGRQVCWQRRGLGRRRG